MAFHPDHLLPHLPGSNAVLHVAYSGGMDSHVLLHALAVLRDAGAIKGELRAIHVNHGLNTHAEAWALHCRDVCKQLAVPLDIVSVNVTNQGQGLEAAARDARHAVFTDRLSPGEFLLTAHHLDDQMETLLFRMLRGTGLRGLAGIRRQRVFAKGIQLRPLLDHDREALRAFANEAGLVWIEDDSNTDKAIDRNYLRHKVFPALAMRWPGFRKNWQRLAGLAEEGQALAEEIGSEDLQQVRERAYRLSIPALLVFSPVRQRNILRAWFFDLERLFGIAVPDAYVIDRVISEIIPAAVDAEPVVSWRKGGREMEIRRYAERLYLVLPAPVSEPGKLHPWQCESPISLPGGLGTLSLVESADTGFRFPATGKLDIGFRQGGENAKPAHRKTRSLKKILQDYQVPPWLRDNTPLLYYQGELLAVADLFVCDRWQIEKETASTEKIYRIQWDRPDLHCGY